MSTKSLVVIILRLFTIYLAVETIKDFALLMPTLWNLSGMTGILYSGLFGVFILFCIISVLWLSAFRLASMVSKGVETQLSFTNLTKEHFYSFAFVFLGILVTLSSIYPTVQATFKFFTNDFTLPDGHPQKGHYLWPLLGYIFQLTAGLFCVFRAQKWSIKLLDLDSKDPSTSSG